MGKFLVIALISLFLLSSCEDPSSDQKALLNVILVDSPAKWDSVFVSFLGVEVDVRVQGRESTLETFYFEYKPGVKEIEISALVGGEALLMARGELPVGNIVGGRLLLGDTHYLWLNDRRYPLPLADSRLKEIPLDFEEEVEFGLAYDMLVDFDLERSIKVLNEDPLTLNLDPKVTAISGIGSGEIEGRISPSALKPAIYVISGDDSLSTQTNTSSTFLFRIPSGVYTIYVDPKDDRYDSLVIRNVPVETNSQTDLELLTILPKE
ncbi:DUF4382 domain-containing protein [Algoriphagus namhaensis]|uniref:DUF4382 domain-containing protein n=1 Tax=Algoriphagus namhaensis TaxID=915353 RepID=A0ABV8APZ8_9BACT